MVGIKTTSFVHSGISQSADVNDSPIYGYQDVPLVPLEDAVKSVASQIPDVEDLAIQAKTKCYKENMELTVDESAAIYLYTMPKCFNSRLNERLREGNREEIEPWFPFLKVFIAAIGKLPPFMATVWRGVNDDNSCNFFEDDAQTWWTVNSCSKDLKVIESFLAGVGTVFAIETIYGKDIAMYSAIPDEQEVVLLPGTRVRRKCDPLEIKDRPFIVSLEEW